MNSECECRVTLCRSVPGNRLFGPSLYSSVPAGPTLLSTALRLSLADCPNLHWHATEQWHAREYLKQLRELIGYGKHGRYTGKNAVGDSHKRVNEQYSYIPFSFL
jgi:hypothetical protein